jgi:polyhydroxyalkanoate synthesis regulator phasin
MPQPLDLHRLYEAGRQLTETSRAQARELGTDLVAQGRIASDYVSAVVDELVGRPTRERTEELRQIVRAEVEQHLHTLGAAIRADVSTTAHVAVDEIGTALDDLRDQVRAEAEVLREVVRDEVQRQLQSLGLATREDLAGLRSTVQEVLAVLESPAKADRAFPKPVVDS